MHYFTVVRHGQTPNNVAKVVQSRTGGELTPLGMEMAKALGKHLKDEKFTRIISSDLYRCKQTTDHIISELLVKPKSVNFTSKLRERDYGDWEFVSYEIETKKRLEMNLPDHLEHQVDIPNGETYEECKKRAGRFFSDVLKIIDDAEENEEENIFSVSHGTIIACLIDYIILNPAVFQVENFTEERLMVPVSNTCRTRIGIGNKSGPGQNSKRVITFTHVYDHEHLKLLK